MIYAIWVRSPVALGPDEKTAVTKSLWMGVNQNPFIPDFKKGGNLWLYILAISFIPYFLYLVMTGQVRTLTQQAREAETFFTAPPELQSAFYDFVLIGRLVSVMFGLIGIYLTYLMATHIYDQRAGRYSAVIVAVNMGFVNTARVATEDMLLTCLIIAAIFTLLQYLNTASIRYFWAATFLSGLSLSAKLTAGFLAAPVAYSMVIVTWRENKMISEMLVSLSGYTLSGIFVTLLSYVLTTPSIVVYPELYISGILGESSAAFANSAYLPSPSWLLHLISWLRAFGLPLFSLVVAGLALLIIRSYHGDSTSVEWCSLLFVVPYAAFIGTWQTTEVWYAIPLVPLFAVYAGYAASVMTKPAGNITLSQVFIALILLFSVMYTGLTVVQSSDDARVEASDWVENKISKFTNVDIY